MANGLTRRDWALLLSFTLILNSVVLSVGGPLTLHEGVLSQTSRAMYANGDWVIPWYGQAPWLERPPMPQWLTCGLGVLFGGLDQEWTIRIGPALAGTATVLLTAWLAAAFFGRGLGMLSGLILATMYQFVRYSTLAEADMFLAPIIAATLCAFAKLEILKRDSGTRWLLLAFFCLLGATNLAKGLVFGTVMTLVPVGFFLLWNWDWRAIVRYVYLPGWIAFAAIALAWPLAVYRRVPDAVDVWHFDLIARLRDGYLGEPWWYYFASLGFILFPWTPFAFGGLGVTASKMWRQRYSPERFLWCWAIATPAVFSLSKGKHHHYMIHFMAPWAILSALAVRWCWERRGSFRVNRRALTAGVILAGEIALIALGRRIAEPEWLRTFLLVVWPLNTLAVAWLWTQRNAAVAVAGNFALLGICYVGSFAFKSAYLHRSNDDTAFLREARAAVGPEQKLLLHPTGEALEGLRMLFYLGDDLVFLHNLTFLHDRRIDQPEVYLISRHKDLPIIEKYGAAEALLQSKKSRREESPADRWTLFRVRLREDLEKKNASEYRISPMQAMYRVAGPDLD